MNKARSILGLALGLVSATQLTRASLVTVPAESEVWLIAEGGSASAYTELGIGPRSNPGPTIFRDLPHSAPLSVSLGILPAGTGIDLWMATTFGAHFEAYSSDLDQSSPPFAVLEAFRDRNNSLGMAGSAITPLGPGDWRLHLDDPASSDDDDNDVIIRIYCGPNPPPIPPSTPPSSIGDTGSTAGLLLLALTGLGIRKLLKERNPER